MPSAEGEGGRSHCPTLPKGSLVLSLALSSLAGLTPSPSQTFSSGDEHAGKQAEMEKADKTAQTQPWRDHLV